MSEPATDHLSYARELLPEYLCGTIWLTNGIVLLALTTTLSELRNAITAFSGIVKHVRVPEFAVGFLIIFAGVLLPYVAGVTLNPLSQSVANLVMRRWYWGKTGGYLNAEHLLQLREHLRADFGLAPPSMNVALMLVRYLNHAKSAVATELSDRRRQLHLRVESALPVGVLSALITYALLGQNVVGTAVGVLVGLVALVAIIHGANVSLGRLDEAIIYTFLMVTARPTSGKVKPEASPDTA